MVRKVKKRKRKDEKENQQVAVDKSLPGVQARCAVFFGIKKSKIIIAGDRI